MPVVERAMERYSIGTLLIEPNRSTTERVCADIINLVIQAAESLGVDEDRLGPCAIAADYKSIGRYKC